MVTLTADVTKEIKEIVEKLARKGLYKSQSEVVRDAIRQLDYKYQKSVSLDEIREITKKAHKRSGKSLSKTLKDIREEI